MIDTASSAVAARSRASRTRSMPRRALLPASARVNTASLPMTTPCSLAPISAPHIHQGRESSTAWVWATWGMSIQVHDTRSPAAWSAAGTHSRGWASFGSRSLFLAKSTPSPVMVTIESHMGSPPPGQRSNHRRPSGGTPGATRGQPSQVTRPPVVRRRGPQVSRPTSDPPTSRQG